MAVVHKDDEIGPVHPRLRTVTVRHFESEVVVLHICPDARMRLNDAAELGFPVAVEDDPIDVAAVWSGFPSIALRRVEADVRSGARRVISIQRDGNLSLAGARARDRSNDPVASHIGDHLEDQLRRVRSSFANQITSVEPLPNDPFQLAEEMKLRLLARIAPLLKDQMGREMVQHLRRAHFASMSEVQINRLADYAGVSRSVAPTSAGVSSRTESAVKAALRRSLGNSTR